MFTNTDNSDDEQFAESSDEDSVDKSPVESDNITIEQEEADQNSFNAKTCLYPKEPETSMIMNHINEKKKIKFGRKAKKIYEYAPGQGQMPTNWIREKNFDIIAFPELFPDGQGKNLLTS